VWGYVLGWVCGTNTTTVITLTAIVYAIQRWLWPEPPWYRAWKLGFGLHTTAVMAITAVV